ncbi:MAG TPA: S8 family serine peptidase [Gaiellaceae bacterium]|nr:S8 family serine peptidase [Gaiellaceae bacterium]
MRPAAFVAVAALAAIAAAVGSRPAASADEPAASTRFAHVDLTATGDRPSSFRPAALGGGAQLRMLQLAPQPLAAYDAAAVEQGRKLAPHERAALRAEIKAKQEPLIGQIEAAGAQVVAQLQSAYDGIMVRGGDPARLAALPGVVAVRSLETFRTQNERGVPFVGTPPAWNTGLTGAGVKVAIIDSGIDYTHANFGGPGTRAAYLDAFAHDTEAPSPSLVGPAAPKVKAGFDFVGDDYNASSSSPTFQPVPHPDPNPLDCDHGDVGGHGSHVAGTLTGFGVLGNGTRYTGPYDATTISSHTWSIGPGVAPEADLYFYRVFGCSGSSQVVALGIDAAVAAGVDVISMSLGAPFGGEDSPTAVATQNAIDAGITVVTSAGNEGPSGYIVGSPSTVSGVLSVAAIDGGFATIPGATFALSTGKSFTAINANGGSFANGTTLNVEVIRNADGTVSLGCQQSDFGTLAANTLAVVARGVCARVHKAIVGQKAGAAAVAMINNAAGLPPFEGPIAQDPDTGEFFTVTIPFFGVNGPTTPNVTDAADLVAADGGTVTLTNTSFPNPGYKRIVSFSSGGPRNGDSALKPEISAPGVSVVSTGVGSGNQPGVKSGTSMSAPHVSGAAVLLKELHPTWGPQQIKAALMNTADPSLNVGYNARLGGTGVLQVQRAIATSVLATTADALDSLLFGYVPGTGTYTASKTFTLTNYGASPASYDLAVETNGNQQGASVALSAPSVTVPAGGHVDVTATLTIPAASFTGLPTASNLPLPSGSVLTIRGAVVATPTAGSSTSLRVPYLVAPRGLSNVVAGARAAYVKRQASNVYDSSVTLTNSGLHSGDADLYAWGVHDPQDGELGEMDVRDVGVQVAPATILDPDAPPSDKALVFAVNTYGRWSTAAANEFDIAIDLQHNGKADYLVVGVDLGAVLLDDFNGQVASFVFDADGNLIDAWLADAPMNGSTVLLPVLASDIGLGKQKGDFAYAALGHSVVHDVPDDPTAAASFDIGKPAVSSGFVGTLAPGGSATAPLWADFDKLRSAPALGWLAVTVDDDAGAAQADEIALGSLK